MAIKFSVSKEKILDGLQRVQNVVSTRTTLPILSNVLVHASAQTVNLTTTDLDVAVRSGIEAEVGKQGATTLPARKLFTILREVVGPDIDIEVDDKNAASVRSGSSFYKIMGLPEDEFPKFPQSGGGKTIKIAQATLRDLLKKTAYAVSTDETRYVLNGVYLSFKGGKLTMVATDGRRLALTETEIESPKGGDMEMIIPTKAITELQRLLGDQGDAELDAGANQLVVNFGATSIATKLIEGAFPNFRQVIPGETKERISLEREVFLAALHRASIFASEKSQSIRLNFAKNQLTITATTPDVGEARETMAINYKGKELAIAFNPQYLMDPLRNLDEDEVHMELTDELSPGVLKINAPFIYVLMPMRLT